MNPEGSVIVVERAKAPKHYHFSLSKPLEVFPTWLLMKFVISYQRLLTYLRYLVRGVFDHRSTQFPRTDLNKRFLPTPMTTTA